MQNKQIQNNLSTSYSRTSRNKGKNIFKISPQKNSLRANLTRAHGENLPKGIMGMRVCNTCKLDPTPTPKDQLDKLVVF